MERNWRFRRRRIPSGATLVAWLQAQPWLAVTASVVSLTGVLTPTQMAAARGAGTAYLAAQVRNGPATWAQLVAALTASGMTEDTAKMAAMTNPVLVHAGPDRYQLRGND